MIDHQEYRARLTRCLDDRREPLDDTELVAFLDAHPEHLDDFASERADLREVASLPSTTLPSTILPSKILPRPKWRAPITAAAAATFALGWGIWQAVPGDFSTGEGTARVAASTATGTGLGQRPSRILSASLLEVEPRLHAAANYTVHERLVQNARITLEAYEQRSELR